VQAARGVDRPQQRNVYNDLRGSVRLRFVLTFRLV
jgi:hypothetical protein